jgi:hypothetical protein
MKHEAEKPGVVHKGTIVTIPQKPEKPGTCQMKQPKMDSCLDLYSEPCNAAVVRQGQIDFIHDSGTVNGIMGEKEMVILKNVSKMYGDTTFCKT